MHISRIQLRNFRCFSRYEVEIDAPLVLIAGKNGAGKTSILEALHYACYLRSFRTHSPRELVAFEQDAFFVKVSFSDDNSVLDEMHEVQVGFSGGKRSVKIDQKAVSSYKELNQHYRTVTLTQDDFFLIKGGPDVRRAFLDQALILHKPEMLATLKEHKKVLQQRNAFLAQRRHDKHSYEVWSGSLWKTTHIIQKERVKLLKLLQKELNSLVKEYLGKSVQVTLNYKAKKDAQCAAFEQFVENNPLLEQQEYVMGRTLFGAHLDDLEIKFAGKASKSFSSRGQQKLAVMLIKIAQLQLLSKKRGKAVFLLDDFMSEFDQQVAEKLLNLLTNLSIQLIFTSPGENGLFEQSLIDRGAQQVSLTI